MFSWQYWKIPLSLRRYFLLLCCALVGSETLAKSVSYVADDDFEIILTKLNERHINLKEFNLNFVNFLRSEHIDEESFFDSMLSDDPTFDRYIDQYLKSFKDSNGSKFKLGLTKQLNIVLFNEHGYEPDSAEAKKFIIQIVKSGEVSSPALVYDTEALKAIIAPLMARFKLKTAFEQLRKNLNNWFLTFTDINERYVDYLSKQDLKLDTINEMKESKASFRLFAKTHFEEFNRINEDLVYNTKLEEMQAVLNSEYQKIDTRHRSIIKTIDDEGLLENIEGYLLYSRFEFKQQAQPIIDGIIQRQYLDEAYKDLETSINLWIPNTQNFAEKFSNFSRAEDTDWSQVKSFSEEKGNFFSNDNKVLSKFSLVHETDFDALVRELLKKTLKTIDGAKVESNFNKLTSAQVEKKVTLEMLGDSSAFKDFIKNELAGLSIN